MVDLKHDETAVMEPGPETPMASGLRFVSLTGGGLAVEMYDEAGNAMAYALVAPEMLPKVRGRFVDACEMATVCSGEGLAGMDPQGTA